MQDLQKMKTELEELLKNNSSLHDMYVTFRMETPEGTYNLTLSADKFLEYIDEAIIYAKDGTIGMSADEADIYNALVWERFISNLKDNFNEFARASDGYSCEIKNIRAFNQTVDPRIELMGELLMAEYAISTYKNSLQAVQKIEKSVQEDYGDVLDGSTYHFSYTKTEAVNNINHLKANVQDDIENTEFYSVEEHESEGELERRYDSGN